MEYKLYTLLRTKAKIPYYLRLFFGFLCIGISIIPIIFPLFPGSFVAGLFLLIVGILLLIEARKIKHTIKLRKSITYLFKHFHSKIVVKRKIRDIKRHVRNILNHKN